jgi:hypothetical protein
MTYLATEWFTCERCAENAAHEWHLVASRQLAVTCPTVALSVCRHCQHAIVWIDGVKAETRPQPVPARPSLERLGSKPAA